MSKNPPSNANYLIGNNKSIAKLLSNKKINKNEFYVLFEDKTEWKSDTKKIKIFWEAFYKVKDEFEEQGLFFDFSHIHFPNFESDIEYTQPFDFYCCVFYTYISFKEAVFEDEVKFNKTVFRGDVDFSEVHFKGDTYFKECKFGRTVTFENSECEGSFDFSEVSVKKLNLEKTSFPKASYINLKGLTVDCKEEEIKQKHFETRESARVIKAHLEAQKNISEANKYFVIEQNMHYDDIKENNLAWNKKLSQLIPLWLDKNISNFGTSWAKVLAWIVGFSFCVLLLHDYIPITIFSLETPNRMIELINPVSIFKNKNLYEGIEFWGMMVKVITIYLFWQFAKSFRVQTKRN